MLIYLQMLGNEEDKRKITLIYEKYRILLFYTAKRILGNDTDAEDVVHEALLAIMKNLYKISDIDCPKTQSYLVTIVESKAIDHIRRYRHETGFYDDTVDDIGVKSLENIGLMEGMQELPLQYKDLLLLRYVSGYSVKEIAVMLGKSHDTVEKTLWRAKQALEKRLHGKGWIK